MPLSLTVGLSGGLDSTVLLHLLWRLRQEGPSSFQLSAVHVDHGLQPAAKEFAVHCERLCQLLDIHLQVIRLSIPDVEIAQLGIEAAARRLRMRAFAECMDTGGVLVLAHHRDDLIETTLLQWIRGAGLEGLSAMSAFSEMQHEGHRFIRWRPLLGCGRDDLLRYAQAQQLTWVEDPTNAELDFARNRIRHEVMPVLRGLREGADLAMARSIGHLQTARELLESFTADALQSSLSPAGELNIGPLLDQTDAWAAWVIRAWLRRLGAPIPPARRLDEFLRQLRLAREPYAQMDLADPATGEIWRVIRDRELLRIQR